MASAVTFNKLVLNCINSPGDYPRGYQVNVSRFLQGGLSVSP